MSRILLVDNARKDLGMSMHWLNPDSSNLAALHAVLQVGDRAFYEPGWLRNGNSEHHPTACKANGCRLNPSLSR
jgi:hypothetical protein